MFFTQKEIDRLPSEGSVSGFFSIVGIILMIIGGLMLIPLIIIHIVTENKRKREHMERMAEIERSHNS